MRAEATTGGSSMSFLFRIIRNSFRAGEMAPICPEVDIAAEAKAASCAEDDETPGPASLAMHSS